MVIIVIWQCIVLVQHPIKSGYNVFSTYKYNALFARINYNLKNRYLLNVTSRRNGSNRFGSKNLFHTFGSIGAAWIFSEENLIKNIFPFLSFGKLRCSFGTTGNDQIADYQFLNLYSPVNGVSVPYQNSIGFIPTKINNPYLSWEETKKLQFGLDLGLFRDRIVINANYYRNRSSNQLLSYSLPIMTGFSGILRNFPALVQNTELGV